MPAQGEYQPLICLMLHMDERSRLSFTSAEKRDSVDHDMVFNSVNVHRTKLGEIVSNVEVRQNSK